MTLEEVVKIILPALPAILLVGTWITLMNMRRKSKEEKAREARHKELEKRDRDRREKFARDTTGYYVGYLRGKGLVYPVSDERREALQDLARNCAVSDHPWDNFKVQFNKLNVESRVVFHDLFLEEMRKKDMTDD